MNLVYVIIFFVAGVEVCRGVPTDALRRRKLARKLNFHPSLDIINGTKVKITDYPFAAAVRVSDWLYGSGVVINNSWILTSADSVYMLLAPEQVLVSVGSPNWSLGGQEIPAQQIIIHEKFNWKSLDYNIALIKLNETIKFGKKVKPATLGTKPLKEGTVVTVIGWGESTESSTFPISEYLRAANVTTMKKKKCESTIRKKLHTTFCTAFDNKGPCLMDTGDPAIVDGVVYGVYTSMIGCYSHTPSVYTDITQFLPWIQSHIW